MKRIVGALLCLFGVVFLTTSDALINMSASYVVGSSAESTQSAQYVAIGISIALIAVGAVLVHVKDALARYAVALVVIMASAFSAALTVQGVSIDYAANENSGAIQSARQDSNTHKIKRYEREIKQLERKMKECAKDNYFVPCASTERRLAALSDKIAEISDDSVASRMSEKINVGHAIEAKSGIPPEYVEKAIIFSRALCVPLLITILSYGFWFFWESRQSIGLKKKQSKTVPKTSKIASSPVKNSPKIENKTQKTNLRTKPKGKHTKNRTKVRTFIYQYLKENGKYPTYSVTCQKCRVGRDVVSEIMKEIKSKAA